MSHRSRIWLCVILIGVLLLVALALTDCADASAACYFAQVQFTVVVDRDLAGYPVTWYVYFYPPGGNRMVRSLTFWSTYAPGDWLRICNDGTLPWGEWHFTQLPLVLR